MALPVPLEELLRMRSPLRSTYKAHKESLNFLEQFALWITKHVGSVGFFVIIVSWTGFWIAWNMFGPQHLRFDPYPAFQMWLFASNVIQLTLLPLIMVGQNLQNKHTEVRAEHEVQIGRREERELEAIIHHLENQSKLLQEILEKNQK